MLILVGALGGAVVGIVVGVVLEPDQSGGGCDGPCFGGPALKAAGIGMLVGPVIAFLLSSGWEKAYSVADPSGCRPAQHWR
jgi:hypothetical protein